MSDNPTAPRQAWVHSDGSVTVTLIPGDCVDVLQTLPGGSVDSVVTDPPYEIGFMGKAWDNSGVAYNTAMWRECLRVLKPGGHLLAFGATRSYHRMAVAIEDAGFEIRDSIHWTYGSGFPKSLNVAKALDKAAGAGRGESWANNAYGGGNKKCDVCGKWLISGSPCLCPREKSAPAAPEAQRWQGWGTALKPSHEPVVVARKPFVGTVAQNVQQFGTGGMNIDGCRVGRVDGDVSHAGSRTSTFGTQATISGGDGSGGWEQSAGRWPANTILTHSAGCSQTGETEETVVTTNGKGFAGSFQGGENNNGGASTTTTTPVFECVEGCPVPVLDGQSGTRPGGSWNTTTGARHFNNDGKDTGYAPTRKDPGKGGASRYFQQTVWDPQWDLEYDPFYYSPKPGKKERNAGLEGLPENKIEGRDPGQDARNVPYKTRSENPVKNTHPTVKPVALMRYLVRLVTPPGGVVLDPFAGSGTTAVAAVLEGVSCVSVERTVEYLPLIEQRVRHALTNEPPTAR